MRANLHHWRLAAAFFAAAFFALHGFWIPVKAELAQWLLDRSWNQVQAGAEWAPPWPWADTQPVARLVVPDLDVNQLVLAGDSGRNLAFGPALHGSLSSRDLVISGHRDTHFTFLRDLNEGDRIIIETPGEIRVFEVAYQEVIDTTEHALVIEPGVDRLSMVTCYPFDALTPGGPLRYVVTALPLEDIAGRGAMASPRIPPSKTRTSTSL